jgi:RNA polymerase sigma-70 factor, ECF subfamily
VRSPRDNDVARRTRFEQLYEAHHAAVLADALRRAERTVAHDVTAETFLVAWRWLEVVPCRRDALAVRGGRRVLANERRAESRSAALAERMRAVWLSQPHGDAAARDGLL